MAFDCAASIAAAIISDCTTQKTGGAEELGWVGRRDDLIVTYDATNPALVTGLTTKAGTHLWTIKGVKRNLNFGSDIVVSADRADRWTHHVSFPQFEMDAASIANLDAAKDLVFIFEAKDKSTTGNGEFILLGLKGGLHKSADSFRINDANGARTLEFTNLEGETEVASRYIAHIGTPTPSYALTLEAIVALEAVPV